MATSLLSSNPSINSDRSSTRRRKRKKINTQTQPENLDGDSAIQWNSDTQQQIYSSKLLHALRQVRLSGGASSFQAPAPKRVRDAADRVLAAMAKGRSRWSRSIFTNRLKLKFMKKNNIVRRERQVMTVITAGNSRLRKKSKVSVLRLKSKCLHAVQRKARVLGRLVPGCRKQPLPVVLEEATDYIPALEMQVKAMSALLELLSVAGSTSTGSAGPSRLDQPGSSL